jgi:hypothetical protein
MIAPKAHKESSPKTAAPMKNSIGAVTMMPSAVLSEGKTRERAYELYESRGRKPGHDVQDWLRAESEILKGER